MSRGVKFGTRHTSTYFGLSMTDTPPNVGSPAVNENYINVPGGVPIDASEYPSGLPTYGNREMQFEFAKKNADMTWPQVASKLMTEIHGRNLYIILDDDTAWRYKGRIKVQPPNLADGLTRLTVNVTALPYKEYSRDLIDPWTWDGTDFDNDVLLYDNGLTDLELTEYAHTYTLPRSVCSPTVTVTLNVTGFYGDATSGYVNICGYATTISETGTYTITETARYNAVPSVNTHNLLGTMSISYRPRIL